MSIPNMLSVFRIVLIPVFLAAYLMFPDRIWLSAVILLVSGLTDVVDGIIARKCNMVTQLGKILDPLADKLTQAAVSIALCIRHPELIFFVVIFVVKEVLMLTGGCVLMKSGKTIRSSKWFGKAATVVLYAIMTIIIVFPSLPSGILYLLSGIAVGFVVFAFIMYIPEFLKIKKSE
ncbi:MAG: CDP-alcohol phosphatidyltransferase family protein [Clostridiales bacterium]|nr:CDP-alcohol phosphatidyltransferase family protein [Clostridiales bacterium]